MPAPRMAALKRRTKSRQGCGNCKLRKVKCDERRPKCERCIDYGVLCNYDVRYSDLQLCAAGSFQVNAWPACPHPLTQSIPNMVPPILRRQSIGRRESLASHQLADRDLNLLKRFQAETTLTIGTGQLLQTYQKEMIRLACSFPYLMHAILTLTLMHERHLSSLVTPLSAKEAFHWHQSVTLFTAKLSGPVESWERDSLWATSMCLGIVSFYYVEAQSPYGAWPLKSPSASDLHWLKMTEGKKEVWRAVGPPAGNDSLFKMPYPENIKLSSPPSIELRLDALPFEFVKLYRLDSLADDEDPYRAVLVSLAQSLHIDAIASIILGFLSFIGNMRPDYKRLLELKDPRALLLLAYWFAKACQAQNWWISRRAALEGHAICIYLERYHRHQADIMTLLRFPIMVFRDFPP